MIWIIPSLAEFEPPFLGLLVGSFESESAFLCLTLLQKSFTVSKLSGLLDAFLSPIVRIDVYWYSPGLYDLEWRREFEAILEGNLLPFTRTWPVVIWEQLNDGFPILLRSLVFNIFHTLKRNFESSRAHIISSISLKHSTVNKSSIRVLNGGSMWGKKNSIRVVGLAKTSYPDLILLANPYWHYICNFTVTESSVDNEDLLYCLSASEHSSSSLMVSVMFISLPAMTVERNIYIMIKQPNNNS